MPFQSMEQGIKAVQAGNLEEGARLLRITLKDDQVTGRLRAVALMWLAETNPDRQFKLECYNMAIAVDPQNQDVKERLSLLLSAQLPPAATASSTQSFPQVNPSPTQSIPSILLGDSRPMQSINPTAYSQPGAPQPYPYQPPRIPTDTQPMQAISNPFDPPPQPLDSRPLMPQQQYNVQGFYRTVGIYDGPNGVGTGFFVTRDGLVATTRYLVGGVENLVIELSPNQQIHGRVVRAFPEFDLALIRVNLVLAQLLTITNMPAIQENTPLVVVPHNGNSIKTVRRATKHETAPSWFPVDLKKLGDAGGDPIFDERSYLVGMMTKNANRTSGHLYGLHISLIYRCIEHYIQETRMSPNRLYCPTCGYVSRAGDYRAFYCENCGGLLPYAANLQRYPQVNTDPLYGENLQAPCSNCSARVGYYNGACIRCGYKIIKRR